MKLQYAQENDGPAPNSTPLSRRTNCPAAARRRGGALRILSAARADRSQSHQIDAVIFALKRIPEGGCILADEVGLGKTIEAGLILAQLRAEGSAPRILLIVPKPNRELALLHTPGSSTTRHPAKRSEQAGGALNGQYRYPCRHHLWTEGISSEMPRSISKKRRQYLGATSS